MATIKKNLSYNLALTFCGYIFPLLTYPYVSRVLGVTNIGICNFVDSIINYFVLFSALGITSLGVREIAKVKDDKQKCSEVFSTLVFINAALSVIMTIGLVIACYTIDKFMTYRPFLFVGISKLLLNTYVIEWFYQGISNFKYITIRSFIIRCIYTVNVFAFVHSTNDTLIYYGLSCVTTVFNAGINWHYAHRFVSFSWKKIRIPAYIASVVSYGTYRILTSLYTSFNITYLGFVSGDKEVGYYTTATKLYTIIISVITALTTVMIPKVSELISKDDNESLKGMAEKTFQMVFTFAIPLVVVCNMCSPLIIRIIAGTGYDGAVVPFRIITTLLLIVGMEQIIIQQFLMAKRDNKCILILSFAGACIGLLLNITLTPSMASIGSAISWTASELAILVLSLYYFKKHFAMTLPYNTLIKELLLSIPYILICTFIYDVHSNLKITITFSLCLVWFCISNVIIYPKETIILPIKNLKRRFNKS